jgi:hypothetical protein
LTVAALVAGLAVAGVARAEEISLFAGNGQGTAYIDTEDDMTIYLWAGTPVAYLEKDSDGYNVYGYNGKHLGWYVDGVVRDHKGDAACAVKAAMRTTTREPFKGFKKFQPFKAFTQFAPFQPFLSTQWGVVPCGPFLEAGAK